MAKTITWTKMLVPSSKYNIKCPYSMNPSAVTRHDTANDASAMSEISYMIGNSLEVSYHVAVDDYRAVQGLPFNRNGWHAGDGSKATGGNRTSIGVETCYSKSGGDRYVKACDNALTVIAKICHDEGIPVTRVFYHKHWSGKNCPHRLISQGVSESEYRTLVQNRYNEMYGGGSVVNTSKPSTSASGLKHKVGETVSFKGLATSSTASSHTTNIAVKKGKITRIVSGAKYPYLINGGTGWVNDSLITSGSSSSTSSSSTSYYKKYTGNSTSLDTILKDIGVPSTYYGNWEKRKPLAKANGISNYSGTASQNEKLKSLAKTGKLKKVGSSSSSSNGSSSYYKKYTGSSNSLNAIFKAIGVPSSYYGSWEKRKPVAKANGISNYTGTASQNEKLKSLAKSGKLKKA